MLHAQSISPQHCLPSPRLSYSVSLSHLSLLSISLFPIPLAHAAPPSPSSSTSARSLPVTPSFLPSLLPCLCLSRPSSLFAQDLGLPVLKPGKSQADQDQLVTLLSPLPPPTPLSSATHSSPRSQWDPAPANLTAHIRPPSTLCLLVHSSRECWFLNLSVMLSEAVLE